MLGERGRIEVGSLTEHYDKKFGRYSPEADRWQDEKLTALEANPQLRRIDVIAEHLFLGGCFNIKCVGPVTGPRWQPQFGPRISISNEGLLAIIVLRSQDGFLKAILRLDVEPEEVKFSSLRIVPQTESQLVHTIRLSLVSRGVMVRVNDALVEQLNEGMRNFPESIHESAAEAPVFRTIVETEAELRRSLSAAGSN